MEMVADAGSPVVPSVASVARISFLPSQAPAPLDEELAVVSTVSRCHLGAWQLARVRATGAVVQTGVAVTQFDLPGKEASVGTMRIRYRYLIGADGADSGVRRALGLPSPRAMFAGEFNVPGRREEPLCVACDGDALENGYWWIFPHVDYTSIGAIAPKRLVAPPRLRAVLERAAATYGVPLDGVPFEGATLEVEYRGVHFADDVHLVGDAAGLPSAWTGEGIYPAIVSGEEVARSILQPTFPTLKLRRWLQTKRLHAACLALLARRRARGAAYWAAARAVISQPLIRRAMTLLLTAG
jgi:flavin-dependent dehydrogenase